MRSNIVQAELQALQLPDVLRYGSVGVQQVVRAIGDHYGPVSLDTMVHDLAERNRIRREWSKFFDRFDLALMPVSAQEAFENDFDFKYPQRIGELFRAQRFVQVGNTLGFPTVAVPTGLSGDLPVGVQLMGAPFDDELCLRGGEAVEAFCGTLSETLWAKH